MDKISAAKKKKQKKLDERVQLLVSALSGVMGNGGQAIHALRARNTAALGKYANDQEAFDLLLRRLQASAKIIGKLKDTAKGTAIRGALLLAASLTKPSVHINGTSANELMRQLQEAHRAGRKFVEALEDASPNARDYYPQGDSAFSAARKEHEARVQAVVSVMKELEALLDHVVDHR